MRRSSSKRALRPGLTVSLSSITPSGRPLRRIASGVAPRDEISSASVCSSAGASASRAATIASTAPLRTTVPSVRMTPLVRDSAENGTRVATEGVAAAADFEGAALTPEPETAASRSESRALASSTTDRPSGVSSSSEVSSAASRTSRSATPGSATMRDARRLPKVIVPVLSRSSTSTSPAASTALPLIARTLKRATRSMPAMPMAESRPPMVVGMRHTSRATRTTIPSGAPEYSPKGRRVAVANRKTMVSPDRRIESAISFGVRCRFAPSTRAIIRSRNVSPGLAVMQMVRVSLVIVVPPVTLLLMSVPGSLRTAADSPVMTASLTYATPAMTSPSPAIVSPSRTTMTSPARRREEPTSSNVPSSQRRWASVSERVLRRLAA